MNMARISKDQIDLFYQHNIDLSSKTLYLGYGLEEVDHELDHKCAADMVKGLHLLDRIRPEEQINIIINCQGGDVDHGLAIYDAIRGCSSRVVATVMGHCWSMATWVLQAADYRRATLYSSIMIHDGEGPKDRFTKKQDILCRKILLDRIRQKHPEFPVTKLQKMLDTDTYFTAQEALDIGLIDGVVE